MHIDKKDMRKLEKVKNKLAKIKDEDLRGQIADSTMFTTMMQSLYEIINIILYNSNKKQGETTMSIFKKRDRMIWRLNKLTRITHPETKNEREFFGDLKEYLYEDIYDLIFKNHIMLIFISMGLKNGEEVYVFNAKNKIVKGIISFEFALRANELTTDKIPVRYKTDKPYYPSSGRFFYPDEVFETKEQALKYARNETKGGK